MAISKNRLEELIKQGATIYWLCGDFVSTTRLNNLYYISECNILCKNNINGKECVVYLKDLYETRKQAEWHLKHHATRTEELDLPTWEEFKKDCIGEINSITFIGRDWETYQIYISPKGAQICLDDYCEGSFLSYKRWKATEENYEKTCDLCLKLFKGEQE